jgi:hypothetical protein
MKNYLPFLLIFLLGNSLLQAQSIKKGLLLDLKMNGNGADSSGNGYHATVVNATLDKDRFGNANKAYSFNGTNAYLKVSNFGNTIPTDSITVSFWIKPNVVKGANSFMLMTDNSSNRFAGSVFYDHTGKCSHFWDYGSISKRIFYQTDTLKGDWTHFVLTRNAGTLKMYKNGKLLQSVNNPNNFSKRSGDLWIGGGADGLVHGLMDEFKIYNRVLDSTEMNWLYVGEPQAKDTCYYVDTIHVKVYDTTNVKVYDTVQVYIHVQDTLSFKLNTASSGTPKYIDVQIYPNPASSKITVNIPDFAQLNNYTLKIFDHAAKEVYSSKIIKAPDEIDVSSIGGTGVKYIEIYDSGMSKRSRKTIIIN